jgi:hypothetical protein
MSELNALAPSIKKRRIIGSVCALALYAGLAAGAITLEMRPEWKTQTIDRLQETHLQALEFSSNTIDAMSWYAQQKSEQIMEVRLPEFQMPEIELPQISMPDFEWPDIKLPEMPKLPEISMPSFEWPDIKLPALPELPEISLPSLTLPELPTFSMPDFQIQARLNSFENGVRDINKALLSFLNERIQNAHNHIINLEHWMHTSTDNVVNGLSAQYNNLISSSYEFITDINASIPTLPSLEVPSFAMADFAPETELEVAQIKPAAGIETTTNAPEETAPSPKEEQSPYMYELEDPTIEIEAVLVPQKSTVLSSSRDGKIKKIHFDNGEMFRKGDVLISYDCDDLQAEYEALSFKKSLTQQKSARSAKLLMLDLISGIEQMEIENETAKAEFEARIVEARMQSCEIRAAYDGRVTNRLANDNEYTRTDRVLMEIGSLDDLEVDPCCLRAGCAG